MSPGAHRDVGEAADVGELCELVLHGPRVHHHPEHGLHRRQPRPQGHPQGKPGEGEEEEEVEVEAVGVEEHLHT